MSTTDTVGVIRLAKLARSFLRPGHRQSDGSPCLYFDQSAPPWVAELAVKAFGPATPTDWSYEFVQDALDHLADQVGGDGQDPHDETPDLDSLYPYTADRLRWLASHLDRPGYCDEAAEEWGGYHPGSGRGFAVPKHHASLCVAVVSMGMAWELENVYRSVLDQIEKQLQEEAGE